MKYIMQVSDHCCHSASDTIREVMPATASLHRTYVRNGNFLINMLHQTPSNYDFFHDDACSQQSL